jgi:histidinol-phosphate aminotransferase
MTPQTSPNLEQPVLIRPHISKLRPYVPGKPIEEVQRELGLPADFEIFKLASNENVLGPSPRAIEAIKAAAPHIWLYPDDTCFTLKNALAEFWNITPQHLILGNGSDEIIHFLGQAFLDSAIGDEVILADPSFVQYKSCAMMADCDYKLVPLTDDLRHDLPAMKAAISERTKIVFIANPNNPTGTVVSRAELEEFLKDLPPRVLTVLDQAYYEYVEDEDSPNGLDFIENHNVIVLHTFSKAYALAGLRVGYGIARPELMAHLQQVRGPFNVNSLAQAAALASLGDDEQVKKAREVNASGKAQLEAAFDELGLEYSQTEANFVFVDCRQPSKELFSELLKRGVIVRTGDPFGMPTWLRVTIGTPEMNARFISALREVLPASA